MDGIAFLLLVGLVAGAFVLVAARRRTPDPPEFKSFWKRFGWRKNNPYR